MIDITMTLFWITTLVIAIYGVYSLFGVVIASVWAIGSIASITHAIQNSSKSKG